MPQKADVALDPTENASTFTCGREGKEKGLVLFGRTLSLLKALLMKTPLLVSGLALSAAVASSAHAGFTGFSVENMGNIGGRDVYQVYANFDASTDIILNLLKHNVTAGSMSGVLHDDFGGGTWNPTLTLLPNQVANDSFVTMNGLTGLGAQTNLDPSFGAGTGSDIPANAGWFNSAPGTNIVVGSSLRIMIMQVALTAGNAGYTASLEVGYKVSASSTTPVFGSGSYTIPAPGAIALLGVAGLIGRRRRA